MARVAVTKPGCVQSGLVQNTVLQTLNDLEWLLGTAMAFTQPGRRAASWPPLPPFPQG